MTAGICPNCESKVAVGNHPHVGLRVTCKTCMNEFMIVWLNPIELEIIDNSDFIDEDYSVENYRDFD